MKKNILLAVVLAALLLLTACGPTETGGSVPTPTAQTEISAEQPTDKPIEHTTEPTSDLNADPMDVVRTVLNDPQVIFWEDAAMMDENTGGNFGNVAIKQLSEDGSYYQFISNDDGAYMIGNVNFLDMGEFRGSAQAVLIKFQPENVEGLTFTLFGNGEIILGFDENNQPYMMHVQDNYRAPYSDYMPTSLTLQSDKWYWALMAFDSHGYYRSLVWEDGNAEERAYCAENMGDWHGDYKDSNWHLTIAFGPNQTLNIEEYSIMDFDSLVDSNAGPNEEESQGGNEQPFWAVRIGDFDAMSDGLAGSLSAVDVELDGVACQGYQMEALLSFANAGCASGTTVVFEDGSTQNISVLGDAYIVFMRDGEYLEKPLLGYEGTLIDKPVMEIIPN